MRNAWRVLPALAAGLLASSAAAQTIAYTNFLKFDLQSFTSQATAGMFDDDIERVGDASRLMDVDGNRLFTNFSNLSDPATLGDNVLTYSVDHIGQPSTADPFDSGSYLLGWIGKYDRDSEYNFSIFYQRNSSKSMFEDLEDGVIGGGAAGGLDAEYRGWTTTLTRDPVDNTVVGEFRTNFDLERYDERTATDFDIGMASDLSEDLALGGRFFYENDRLDSFSSGHVETLARTGNPLVTTSRTTTEWIGNGEEAFRLRDVGVSLDGNLHRWNNQSFGLRIDLFGETVTNPGFDSNAVAPTLAGLGQPTGPFHEGWEQVNLGTVTSYARIPQGTGVPGGGTLDEDRETRTWNTFPYTYGGYAGGDVTARGGGALALESIDDRRTGVGFAAKGEWNREFAGGDRQTWVGFANRTLEIDMTSTMASRSAATFWWNDGAGSGDIEAVSTTADDTVEFDRAGDQSVTVLEAGTRWNRDLNSYVSVGIGGVLTRESWTEDYTQNSVSRVVNARFDDGSGTFGDNALYAATGSNPAFNEISSVTVTTDIQDVDDETRSTWVRLPVGGQFHFKERWTFNLGAQHTMVNTTRRTTVDQGPDGAGQEVTTTIDTAAGTTVVTYDTGGSESGVTVTERARDNFTTYWYGISVLITDAAQLDVNGFFDTHGPDDSGRGGSIGDVDFFRSLSISLKYMFW